jgi:DNA-binding beta-propeller fold protein YncE
MQLATIILSTVLCFSLGLGSFATNALGQLSQPMQQPHLSGASDLRQVGMVNLPGSPGFGEMAFVNGMLLLAHPGASSVDVFDPAHRRIVAQILHLPSPRSIAFDDQAGKVYIADHDSNSIVAVATDGWRVVDSIPLPGLPDALLLDGAGRLYWTDAAGGTISLLDLRTKQDIARAELGGTPRSLAFDSSRNVVFATLQDQHQIVAVATAFAGSSAGSGGATAPQLKIVGRFNLNASQPTGLAYDSQHRELYVAVRSAVLAVSADTGAEIDRVTAPEGVDALWLDAESQTLYAASEGSLLVMSAKGRLSVADNILTEVKGHTVAYDSAKRLVLLPGGREGKSKLLILRQMNPSAQPGGEMSDARVR